MTALISPALMEELKQLDIGAMPCTMTITRRGWTQNSAGESVSGAAVLVATAPCRFLRSASFSRVLAERVTPRTAAVAYVPHGTPLQNEDLVAIQMPPWSGIALEHFVVTGGDPQPSTYSTSLEVQLRSPQETP